MVIARLLIRRPRHWLGWLFVALRAAAAATALVRLARASRRRPGLETPSTPAAAPDPSITIVIPARNEADRLAPCLASLAGAPGVREVIVVDDCSTDGTAALACRLGAHVVDGKPLPPGWVGKPWALQQGLGAAEGEWLVTLDADTEPDLGLPRALVERAIADGWDFLSVGGRFHCPTATLAFVHPSMLATLVYRFGPPGPWRQPSPSRVIANGQCTVARRDALLAAGGFVTAATHLTDDIALARGLAARGWRVGFLDASTMLRVRMHTDVVDAWRNWGRSLPMPDVTSWPWKLADLAVIWFAQALPLPRLATGRGDIVDAAMALARVGILAGTATAYDRADRSLGRRRAAWWCSPLADVAVAARYTWGLVRPGRTWRGRTYHALSSSA